MVNKISSSMPALADIVIVDDTGHVQLVQPECFQNLISDAMAGSLEDEKKEAESSGKKSPQSGRSKVIARWLRLWLPFNKKLAVQGTKQADGSIAFTSGEKSSALRKRWS